MNTQVNQKKAKSTSSRTGKQQRSASSSASRVVSRKTAPVAKASVDRTGAPKMVSKSNGDIVVKHREFISDVSITAAFTAIQFPIQPGNSRTFPWLASVARRYEKYSFKKLSFHYETQGSTATVGRVILAPDYDPSDAAPLSKVQAASYEDATWGATWEDFRFQAQARNLHQLPKYNVGSGAETGADLKFASVGNLWLCTQGGAGTAVVGELYVEYEVEFFTPDINPNLINSRIIRDGGTVSDSAPFGDAPTLNNGALDITVSTNTITFNEGGNYICAYNVVGTGLVAPTLTGTNVSVSGLVTPIVDAAGENMLGLVYFANVQPGATVLFNTTGSTTVSSSFVTLSPMAKFV